jgi:hypothetical protein
LWHEREIFGKRLTVVRIRKPEDSQSVIGGLTHQKTIDIYRHMFKCRSRAADGRATVLLPEARTYTYLAG